MTQVVKTSRDAPDSDQWQEALHEAIKAVLTTRFAGVGTDAPTGKVLLILENSATADDQNTALQIILNHDMSARTIAQLNAVSDETKVETAKVNALNIPNWATWDETTAVNWITANVTDLASAKQVLIAYARLLVALRDHTWPDLNRL